MKLKLHANATTTPRTRAYIQQSAAGAQDQRGGDALIDAHPAGDEIRGFAQRFQEKAAQSIPSQRNFRAGRIWARAK